MSEQVVDQFCGIGWRFAMDGLDLEETGIDNEPTVALTRAALGWDTLLADIRDLDPAPWKGIDGLISSPPCQSWSRAGKGAGLDDPRGKLVWQPLVWALACRPRWVACEQVPEAAPAFRLIAHRLREVGYHADVYELSSETFGVPQTRRRVFLVAHYDYPPQRPTQTHQRYRKGVARVEPVDMLGLLPWVSMAEALETGFTERPALTVRGASESGGGRGMDGGSGARRIVADAQKSGLWLDTRNAWMPPLDTAERPSPTLTAVAGGKSQWTLVGGNQTNACVRDLNEPSPTLLAHIGKDGDSWAFGRPSTAGAVPYADAGTDKSVALTEAQGCTLMGFPDGTDRYLAGNKQDRWRIIGNAVCPPVARAVLDTLTRCEVAT